MLNFVSKHLEVRVTDQEEAVGWSLYPGSRTIEKLRVAWGGRGVRAVSCVDQFENILEICMKRLSAWV
jgi:hypothetical protein